LRIWNIKTKNHAKYSKNIPLHGELAERRGKIGEKCAVVECGVTWRDMDLPLSVFIFATSFVVEKINVGRRV